MMQQQRKLLKIGAPIKPPPLEATDIDGHVASAGAPVTKNSGASVGTTPYLSSSSDNKLPTTSMPVECYLCGKIKYYMRGGNQCRRDAICKAYVRANCKGYTPYSCDPGFGHGLITSILTAPARLVASFSNLIRLSCKRSVCHSDELICAPLECPPNLSMPRCGSYTIVHAREGTCEDLACGRYEFPASCTIGTWKELRVPLHTTQVINKCIKNELPIADLVIRACLNPDGETITVRDARINAHLKPDARVLLNPEVCVKHAESRRTILEDAITPACCHYCDNEERLAAEPNQRLEEVNEALSKVLAPFCGDNTYRVVGHIGRTMVCNRGTDSPSSIYRIGRITETITRIAVLKHANNHVGGDLDEHSPELTAMLLTKSGALNVLAGLRRAYAQCGSGQLPTLHHLLHHVSSLPSQSPLDLERLQELLADRGAGNMDGTEREKRFGEILSCTRPMCAPGSMFCESDLNTLVLRYMLPDWRSNDCEVLKATCANLGMPSALLSHSCAGKHACSLRRGNVDEALGHCHPTACHMYSHCSGLSVSTEELANYVSAASHFCKHSWDDARDDGYPFTHRIISPVVTVNRKAGISHGYGWYHCNLMSGSKVYGEHGLHAMVRYGESMGGHTVVACRVPGVNLSFAFSTTASLCNLSGVSVASKDPADNISILGIVNTIVGAILLCMSNAGSLHLQRARFFNPVLNSALCVMPPALESHAHHVRYCRSKYPFFAQTVDDLDKYVQAGELVSVAEGDDPQRGCIMKVIRRELDPSPEAEAVGDKRRFVSYACVVKTPLGELISHPLAFDPDACATVREAELAVMNHSRSKRTGCYRTVCLDSGLLKDYVSLASAEHDGETHPVVSFGGRAFVSKKLYQGLRRQYAPTDDELLQDRLASSEEVDKRIESSLGSLANEVQNIRIAGAAIPNNQEIARGGFGPGLALGATTGLLAGAALGVAASPYAVAPYPVVAPYYGPPYPYYYGWRRPWRYRRYPYY